MFSFGSPFRHSFSTLSGLQAFCRPWSALNAAGLVFLADIPQMAFVSEQIVGEPDHRWKKFRSAVIRQPRFDDLAVLEAHLAKFVVIQTHLSCLFHLAVDFLGLRRNGSSS